MKIYFILTLPENNGSAVFEAFGTNQQPLVRLTQIDVKLCFEAWPIQLWRSRDNYSHSFSTTATQMG